MDKFKCLPDDSIWGKVKGSPKLLQLILWGTKRSALNFIAIHPIVVNICHLKPEPHGGAIGRVRGAPKS